jgi:hypothetical protein
MVEFCADKLIIQSIRPEIYSQKHSYFTLTAKTLHNEQEFGSEVTVTFGSDCHLRIVTNFVYAPIFQIPKSEVCCWQKIMLW